MRSCSIPPRAPETARKWLAEVFRQRGLGDDYIGRTVVTELVTNVHRHTDTKHIPVRLLLEDGHTVVEVEDRSDELPVVHAEDDDAESGRGLLMLSMLVQDWGVRALAKGGKVTWARLSG
ncbi:ATP-binding protein [Actinomadura darangshiensis]|uniref:ATP-binding protein n=1 Tax=Actinomadura darangshiensis TaxID=705336 RepID=UPI001407D2DC|nr:ATP-binding protein [Actinomadura darangshiensis]